MKDTVKQTYLVTVERPRLTEPDTVQQELYRVISENCLSKLVSIVNQDDVLRAK